MAFLQADVDAIDAAFKQGMQEIRSADGRVVKFQTVTDYIKLRNLMLNDANTSPGKTPVRFVKTYTDSGF